MGVSAMLAPSRASGVRRAGPRGDKARERADDGAGGAAPQPHSSLPRGDISHVRVLLVDDDADMRDIAQLVLEHAGGIVTTAATGAEALRLMDEPAHFHVLVCDLAMPGQSGIAVIRALRERERRLRQPPLPAIAATAHANPEVRRDALDAGFDDFLAKPVPPAALVEAVARSARPRSDEPDTTLSSGS